MIDGGLEELFPKGASDRRSQKPNVRLRFVGFIIGLGAIAAAITINYAVLMLSETQGVTQKTRITADRGQILDRNGRIFAIQTRLGNIGIWRPSLKKVDGRPDGTQVARLLAPLLAMSEDEILERIDLAPNDFLYLKKTVDRDTVRAIEKLKKDGMLAGVDIEPVMGRIYPEAQLAAQIIGFVGDENTGLAGIEYAFNDELSAKTAVGKTGGVAGNQVILALDANIQYILEEIAERSRIENEAEAVMLLAMNPRTGDVLGAACKPGFDPNNFKNSDKKLHMNRPAAWQYEPGSVFKVFSLASLLDANAINPSSTFLCNGRYERTMSSGEKVVINCLGAHGQVDARQTIIVSCNAGAAYAADRMNNIDFYEAIRNLGFGGKTASGLPGEVIGFLRPTAQWSERSKPTIAMGQEIAVSALQMLQAASAIANDGIMTSPRIVLKITDADGKTSEEPPRPEPKRVFKAETAREMRRYMAAVTLPGGTGTRAGVEDMPLAVKTGTAQMTNPATGRYSETDFIANCIALLPAESPSLIIYGVIIKPKGSSYLGGRIAAPLIRETAEELVNYMGIPRGRNPQVRHTGQISLPGADMIFIGEVMPNLSGYSKRQLLPLLFRDDLHLDIKGDGWVKRQSPPPGSRITSQTIIVLELE